MEEINSREINFYRTRSKMTTRLTSKDGIKWYLNMELVPQIEGVNNRHGVIEKGQKIYNYDKKIFTSLNYHEISTILYEYKIMNRMFLNIKIGLKINNPEKYKSIINSLAFNNDYKTLINPDYKYSVVLFNTVHKSKNSDKILNLKWVLTKKKDNNGKIVPSEQLNIFLMDKSNNNKQSFTLVEGEILLFMKLLTESLNYLTIIPPFNNNNNENKNKIKNKNNEVISSSITSSNDDLDDLIHSESVTDDNELF